MNARLFTFGLFLFKGVLETLTNQLQKLEDEIKADEAGKQEFERILAQVKRGPKLLFITNTLYADPAGWLM